MLTSWPPSELNGVTLLHTVPQAAEVLALSERSVRSLVADGSLPVVRIGRAVRIHPEDLRTFIEERRRTCA